MHEEIGGGPGLCAGLCVDAWHMRPSLHAQDKDVRESFLAPKLNAFQHPVSSFFIFLHHMFQQLNRLNSSVARRALTALTI